MATCGYLGSEKPGKEDLGHHLHPALLALYLVMLHLQTRSKVNPMYCLTQCTCPKHKKQC